MNPLDSQFMELMEIPENKLCADCNASLLPFIRKSNLLLSSISNGILICPTCSDIHNNELSPEVSTIKTIRLGFIDELEFLYFKKGGNKEFIEFITSYGLNNAELKAKYKSKAANFYRAKVQFITSIVESNGRW